MLTVQERLAKYRKQKAQFAREYDNALETVRWHVTKSLLEKFPDLEPIWLSIEDDPAILLELRIRIGDYGYARRFSHQEIDQPRVAVDWVVADVYRHLSELPTT